MISAFLAVMSLVVVASPGQGTAEGLQAAGAPIMAPYQIDAIQHIVDRYAPTPVEVVVVGLGRARDRDDPEAGIPMPDGEDLSWMTIVGTQGFVHAYRGWFPERRCEHLCGGELEECHWVGLYVPEGPLESIGSPVAALPGRLDLTDYVGGADLRQSPDPLARLTTSDSAGLLLYSPWSPEMEARLRVMEWDANSGVFDSEVVLNAAASPLGVEGCQARAHEWLLEVDCDAFALLASGGRPLLLSWADYNLPKVEPLARFVYNGSRHYVVRFGAKAQDVVGLVSAEPAGWRARFRPRDWALLC